MITSKIMRMTYVLAIAADVMGYTGTADGQVIEKGLVHYWSFDKIDKDIVPDLVGKNDVEIVRGKSPALLGGGRSDPKVVKGKLGSALEFDGDGDYAQSTGEIEIDGSDPRTLSAWVKWNTKSDQFHVLVGWGWEGESGQACKGELFCITTWHSNQVTMWGVCNDHESRFAAKVGRWYHVTVTYDNKTELKIYVDGDDVVYDNAKVQPFQTGDGTRATFGKKIFTFADRAWADGAVDEVAIYNRALDKGEVLANFKSKGFAVNPAAKLAVTWGAVKDVR